MPIEHYFCVCFLLQIWQKRDDNDNDDDDDVFSNLNTDRSKTGLARHFSGSTCSSMAAGEPRLNNANTQRGEETHVKIYKCHQSIGDICMLQG